MTNIVRFWDEFTKIHSQLEGEDASPSAMEHLLSCLEEVDQRLYFHLGSHDKGTDLILSAEGHADLMPILDQLKKDAPKVPSWAVISVFEGMLLFGERNDQVFPSTENGDVLYRMARNGDHLWIARDVNFSLVFPNRESAENFSLKSTTQTFRCKIDEYDGAEGYQFQVEVKTEIIPSHETVTSVESHLGDLARLYGGRNDGWGCFEVQS